jgi:type II secretory pathway component PulL
MFQKIKNIKKYIRLAKIGAIIFALIFVSLIAYTLFQGVQIAKLQERVENLEQS